MQFVLVNNPTFWWPVTVHVPNDDKPGEFVEQRFEMEFAVQSRKDAIAFKDGFLTITDHTALARHEDGWLKRICRNWRGVLGPDKSPMTFAEASFEQAIEQPWFRSGVLKAFHDGQSGGETPPGN